MNFDELQSSETASAARDYDWAAFRYVAGEMGADEAATFEGLLADEQPAREAVAAAVLVMQAVPLATCETVASGAAAGSPRSSPATPCPVEPVAPQQVHGVHAWRQRAAWAGAGAAACALVVLATGGFHSGRRALDRPAGVAGASNLDVDRLAQTWSSLAGDETNSSVDAGDDLSAAPSPQSADTDAARSTQDIVEEVTAPGWLMAAVAPEEMPADGESHDIDLD